MNYEIIIRPEAENDLKEAFSWYEDKRIGLGYDFLLQVDAGIRFIKRNPDVYSSGYQETRRHIIKRFPYKIVYFVKEEEIIVLAIIHGRRSPDLIKKREEEF
jgi:plasmid stabilization system protein ParE